MTTTEHEEHGFGQPPAPATVYGFKIEPSDWRDRLRDCVSIDRAPAGNIILRTGREFDPERPGAWERRGHIVLTPEEARRFATEILEELGAGGAGLELELGADDLETLAGGGEIGRIGGYRIRKADPELEFELLAIGYGPATLSNDVTDRTEIHPGDALTARINATGAAIADEIKRQGYELTPGEIDSMRAETADCFAPAALADVAKLIGDSPGLLRSSSDSRTATPEEVERRLEEIGRIVFDSVARDLGAGRSTAEDLDPGDPEDSEIFSRRARLESGRRDLCR